MTWDASLADMQSALDGRFVDLDQAVKSASTAVNCYSYAEAIDALNHLVRLAEETRELYEAMEDKSLALQGEELEKEYSVNFLGEELDKSWQELFGKED